MEVRLVVEGRRRVNSAGGFGRLKRQIPELEVGEGSVG